MSKLAFAYWGFCYRIRIMSFGEGIVLKVRVSPFTPGENSNEIATFIS
jgi:hypothetical protein